MPLVRVDVGSGISRETLQVIGDAVYGAMVEIAKVPEHDRFQIFTRHIGDELVYPKQGYLGVSYSPDIIFIQVFWVAGRSTEVKQAFYKRIADEIHAKAGVRKDDVFINLIDCAREDWSFGGGVMQYAPK